MSEENMMNESASSSEPPIMNGLPGAPLGSEPNPYMAPSNPYMQASSNPEPASNVYHDPTKTNSYTTPSQSYVQADQSYMGGQQSNVNTEQNPYTTANTPGNSNPYTTDSAPMNQNIYAQQPVQAPVVITGDDDELTLGGWMLTVFLSTMPCVNLVMLFVWAFGGGKKQRSLWAKAMLIWTGIWTVLYFLFWIIFAIAGVSLLDKI